MAKVKEFELEDTVPVLDDEDAETLAAIDEGVRDVEAGRTVPSEEVRKLLPKWTSSSSSIQDLSDLVILSERSTALDFVSLRSG
jgi:hypothetical protein